MKKKFFEEHKGIFKRISCLALAAVIAGTGAVTYHNSVRSDIPELVTYVDPETVQVEEDEVPLASNTKTTRKVSKKTTTKKTTMKTKAKKSSTSTKKNTKTSTKTTSSDTQKVKTNIKVATTIKTTTKKNSKVKTTKTTVVTTVTTTTTKLAKKTTSTATASTTSAASTSTASKAGTYSIRSVAPAADARVLSAYESIGCKVVVNPSVSYSGCFDARTRTITLKKLDSTVYHELGHFVEFVGGTSAVKNAIASAYSTEKSLYTASNKAYVLQSSSEYFAESFKNYCENPAALKQARPNTYNAIVQALDAITDSRVNTLKSVYASVWK